MTLAAPAAPAAMVFTFGLLLIDVLPWILLVLALVLISAVSMALSELRHSRRR